MTVTDGIHHIKFRFTIPWYELVLVLFILQQNSVISRDSRSASCVNQATLSH